METNDHGRHIQKVGLVGLLGLVFMLPRTNLWNTFLTALACIGPTWGVPTQVFAAAKGSPNAARKSRMASASWIKPNLNEFYPSGFVISLAMKELKGQQLLGFSKPLVHVSCHNLLTHSTMRQVGHPFDSQCSILCQNGCMLVTVIDMVYICARQTSESMSPCYTVVRSFSVSTRHFKRQLRLNLWQDTSVTPCKSPRTFLRIIQIYHPKAAVSETCHPSTSQCQLGRIWSWGFCQRIHEYWQIEISEKNPRHFFTSNPSSKREWNMKSRKGQKRFETFIYWKKTIWSISVEKASFLKLSL